jgi:uncharacterized membrane protein YczE
MFPAMLWRPGPARLALLVAGLWVFGTGESFLVASRLGNSPWVVLSEGVERHSALSVGTATIAVSVIVLLLWIPLRQAPGLGTVLNAIVIGLAIAVMLPLLPEDPSAAVAWPLMAGGIALVAIGGGIYLGTRLGPGPRDGLMTGLHARTGRSLRLVRTCIEVTVMAGGYALGGKVGVGTVAFALLIGPGVQAAFGWAWPRMQGLR